MNLKNVLCLCLLLILSCEPKKIEKEVKNNEKTNILAKSDTDSQIQKGKTYDRNLNLKVDKEKEEIESIVLNDEKPSKVTLELFKKTLVVITLDSLELENFINNNEEDYQEIINDVLWYDLKINEKMDSLNIKIINTDKDTTEVNTENFEISLVKDSSFGINTYFLFDREKLIRTEVFELLEN